MGDKDNMTTDKSYRKYLTYLAILVFLLSLVPILYLAGIDRASGDDWGYGLLTHRAWIESHSLIKVIQAALQTVHNYYRAWQGTWFSIFLFTFQPEAFSYEMYWIVPYIMLGLLIGSISCFLYQITVRFLHMEVRDFLLVDMIILFLLIQFAPRKKSAIFWYNGTAHYTVPFALALFAMVAFLRFVQTWQKRHVVWAAVWLTLLGGTNYLAAVFGCLGFIFLGVFFYFRLERDDGGSSSADAVQGRKVLWMGIPLVLELIGLLISALAPGNARRGGETYEISLGRMLGAVIEAFRQGIVGVIYSVREHPITLAALIVLAVILWDILREKAGQETFRFPLPGLVIFYFFGTYCAMYWPGIFAGVEVSGGVPNTIYWVFVLMMFCSMLYGLGWLAVRLSSREKKINNIRYLYAAGIAAAFVLVVLGRSNIKESTDYMCLEYILTGQARDYQAQMEQFTQLLTDDTEDEVILPSINDWQGPLMHMPVTEDPDAWTNQTVKEFFGKKRVVSIPRQEWEERMQ